MLKKLNLVFICGLMAGCQIHLMIEEENPFTSNKLSYTELRDDFIFIYDENQGDLNKIILIMDELTKEQKRYLMKEVYQIEQDENKRNKIQLYLNSL